MSWHAIVYTGLFINIFLFLWFFLLHTFVVIQDEDTVYTPVLKQC